MSLTHQASLAVTADMHQILTPEGEVADTVPNLPTERLLQLYRWMVFGRVTSEGDFNEALPPRNPGQHFQHIYSKLTPQLEQQRVRLLQDLEIE